MKKTIKIIGIVFLAIVLLAIGAVVVNDCYGTVNLEYELSEDGTYYICTGMGNSDETVLKIPKKYKNKPVKEIGDSAFEGNTSIWEIELSDNITKIGQCAFQGCSKIYRIDIKDSIEEIQGGAFEGCDNLKFWSYKEGKYLGTEDNPYLVLMGLEDLSLTTFTPAESTKSIYDSAFKDCENLESFEITSNVTCVGIFYGCENLKSITVAEDNKVYSAVDGVLYNKAQTEIWYVPNAMSGNVIIPNTVAEIDSYTFLGCDKIESVTLPSGLTTIKRDTFTGIESLKGVTIPSSVTTIEYESFDNLEYVNITDLSAWCNMDFEENYNPLVEADLYLNGEKVTDLVIPNSVKVIKSNVFLACKSIKTLTFEENSQLEKIEDGAFFSCGNLTSVIFPNSLANIEDSAFYYCPKLKDLHIPEGVKTIGEDAFSECDLLQSVNIPASVTVIGKGAFHGCDILAEIIVDKNNANYSSENGDLFNKDKTTLIKYCDGNGIIPFYTVPNSVTAIENYAFAECDGLERITIPVSVTSIGEGAFTGCVKLKAIYFTSGTKAQWVAISKGDHWDMGVGVPEISIDSSYTVHCKDGDI